MILARNLTKKKTERSTVDTYKMVHGVEEGTKHKIEDRRCGMTKSEKKSFFG